MNPNHRFLADEGFNNKIVVGLTRAYPIEVLLSSEAGLLGWHDREVLEFAAREGRVLLTHDRATMPTFVAERITAGEACSGIIVVPWLYPIGKAIEEVATLAYVTEEEFFQDRVYSLPIS